MQLGGLLGRSRCMLPASAAAVAVLPDTATTKATPPRSAHQLLQTIASATDWRCLQDLYMQHHSTMTTAHVAAVVMQLPKGLPSGSCGTSEGLQGLYMELMPRLEGQLHVLPVRLLLGVSHALDVCHTPCSSSWRAAFLSASASLVTPTIQAANHPITADAHASSAPTPTCSAQEVLSLARHVFLLFSKPGCSEEALSSAALTERLITVLRAAAITADQINSSAATTQPDPAIKMRLVAAAEAALGLLEGKAALSRVEAFPARVTLQLLEALQSLQVKPSQAWLAACYSGLDITAKAPQMTAAGILLERLGWHVTPTARARFASATAASPVSTAAADMMHSLAPNSPPLSSTQAAAFLDTAATAAAAGATTADPSLSARQASHSAASSSTSHTAGTSRRRRPGAKSPSPGREGSPRGGTRTSQSPGPTAPNSALEGMIGLLKDAAASGMLEELKATVFSQLEGCDPALVLWTAEAFHQLGSPLTSRELAQCVHLAASAVDAHDRESDVPAWDVLALVQRCCSQSAAIPPGQLEHLLEYVMGKSDQLQPAQLAEALHAAAALVARASPAGTVDAALASVGKQRSRGEADKTASRGLSVEQTPIRGQLVYQAMETLRPGLSALSGEQAAKVAGALTALRVCGVTAAAPLPAWTAAYCSAAQHVLSDLNAPQLRQVLQLPARANHYPTDSFMDAAVVAACGILPAAPPTSGPTHTDAPSSSVRGTSGLGDVLAVLELVVLDLGCEPNAQLAVDVATQLVPVMSAQAGELSPTELAGSLRLLAAMRCRPPPGAVQRLLGALERYLFQLAPGRLALVAWTCAELGAVPRRTFLSRYLEAAAESLNDMQPESLALLGRSFAQLGIVPDASWQKAYRDAVLARLPEADAETLSVLGQGLLHLGLRPDDAWLKGFLIESTFKLPEADAASVARYAHFMASCEVPPPFEWVQALMERTLAVGPEEYDPPDLLPLVLRSLVRLGWAPDPSWLTELLRRIGARAMDLQPSSLIITATSLATLQATSDEQVVTGDADAYNYDPEVTFAVLDMLLQAALTHLDDFSARELRWLLDPLLMLPDYVMQPDWAESFQHALAVKESREDRRRRRRVGEWQGDNGSASKHEDEGEDGGADKCHDTIAMALNDFVSDHWLATAVMA